MSAEEAVAVLDVSAPPAALWRAVAFKDALLVAIAAGLGHVLGPKTRGRELEEVQI
jgi:hypothetical protein